jgi:hypothetical protein
MSCVENQKKNAKTSALYNLHVESRKHAICMQASAALPSSSSSRFAALSWLLASARPSSSMSATAKPRVTLPWAKMSNCSRKNHQQVHSWTYSQGTPVWASSRAMVVRLMSPSATWHSNSRPLVEASSPGPACTETHVRTQS